MGWSRLNNSICWAIVSAEMSDWAEGRDESTALYEAEHKMKGP